MLMGSAGLLAGAGGFLGVIAAGVYFAMRRWRRGPDHYRYHCRPRPFQDDNGGPCQCCCRACIAGQHPA